jgi:hypothetical protein
LKEKAERKKEKAERKAEDEKKEVDLSKLNAYLIAKYPGGGVLKQTGLYVYIYVCYVLSSNFYML